MCLNIRPVSARSQPTLAWAMSAIGFKAKDRVRALNGSCAADIHSTARLGCVGLTSCFIIPVLWIRVTVSFPRAYSSSSRTSQSWWVFIAYVDRQGSASADLCTQLTFAPCCRVDSNSCALSVRSLSALQTLEGVSWLGKWTGMLNLCTKRNTFAIDGFSFSNVFDQIGFVTTLRFLISHAPKLTIKPISNVTCAGCTKRNVYWYRSMRPHAPFERPINPRMSYWANVSWRINS